jgi:hypothetical protein
MISLKRVRAVVGEALVLARKSSYTLRRHGWREFYAKAVRKLRPPPVQQPAWSKTYASEALILAQWLDFTPEELERSRALIDTNQGSLAIQTINWYVPHFEHAYYGGMYTILRFASFFAQHYGVKSTFVIVGDASSPTTDVYHERIRAAFAPLESASGGAAGGRVCCHPLEHRVLRA